MMYFPKENSLDDNVVWKEDELIYKKIYLHFKYLAKNDEIYESLLKSLLEKFGVSTLIKSLEFHSSFGVVESKKRRAKEVGSPPRKNVKVEENGKNQVILEISDEESDKEVVNPRSKGLEILELEKKIWKQRKLKKKMI
jgi:hypothetical protein